MRAFDLEAAKRGDPICTRDGRKVRFIAYVPECAESHRVVAYVEGEQCASAFFDCGSLIEHRASEHDLFMAPLCEVEGKPVYPSDKLWSRDYSEWVTVTGSRETGFVINADGHEKGLDLDPRNCSWDKPKVRKVGWTNIYRVAVSGDIRCGFVYPTEQEATSGIRSDLLIATVRIEWEE